VGIGTESPGTKLSVNGAIGVGADEIPIQESHFGYSASYKVLRLGLDQSGRSLALNVDPTTVAGASFNGIGDILIGNANILAPNAAGTDWMGVLRATNSKVYLGGSLSSGNLAGDALVVDNVTSNVGIGTANPSEAKLQVTAASGYAIKATGSYSTFVEAAGTHAITVYPNASGVNRIYSDYFSGSEALPLQFGVFPKADVMTLLSSGNVGIGTTSPYAKLSVVGGETGADTLLALGTRFMFTGDGVMEWGSAADFGILSWDGTKTIVGAQIGKDLALLAGGLEKVYITAAGNVGIGTTTPTAQLHTTGTVRFSNFGAGTLTTDASGNVTVSSDERLKNIDGSFSRGLADLQKLSPILYRWNELSGLDQSTENAGFSAQNVQSAIPEAVNTDPRGYLTLTDRPILAASVNAIKELALRSDQLSLATTSLAERLGAVEQGLEAQKVPQALTASSVQADSLTVNDELHAVRITVDASMTANQYYVPNTQESYTVNGLMETVDAPAEVLSTGGASVDLYKFATYTPARTQSLEHRYDQLSQDLGQAIGRLDAIEALLSAGTTTPSVSGNFTDLMAGVGIAFENSITSIKHLVAQKLTIGSAEKPTGVTLYDEVTGDPYCLSIRNGKQAVKAGECGVGDLTHATSTPVLPQPVIAPEPAQDHTTATSTAPVQVHPDPQTLPVSEPTPEPVAEPQPTQAVTTAAPQTTDQSASPAATPVIEAAQAPAEPPEAPAPAQSTAQSTPLPAAPSA
jgi:hypothetical protein